MATLLQFITNQAKLARYWYEKVPYTAVLTNLAASGQAPIFSATHWNGANVEKLATLEDLAVSQISGLILLIQDDEKQRSADAGAMPPNVAPIRSSVQATSQLALLANNQTGATVDAATVNYAVAVQQLAVSDKLLRGLPLSPKEQAISGALGMPALVHKGTFPIPITAQVERTFKNRVIQEEEYLLNLTQAPTSLATVSEKTANTGQGEFLILRSLAAQANAADGITLLINRDSDDGYAQLAAANLSLAQPTDCFIPALEHLSIQAIAATAGPLQLRIRLWRVKFSNVLRLRFGLIDAAEAQAQGLGKLYQDVWGGLN